MISLIEINHLANIYNVAAETIEKDYMISWILLCLSRSQLKNNFIFYGGTAIKRMYFEDHRFSEDIDLFSVNKYSIDQILADLNCLLYAQEQANLILEINRQNIIVTKSRAQLYVTYLGYEEIIGAPKEIRLDFCMDMQCHGNVIEQQMIESYSDIKKKHITLSVLSLNSILSNKLGLLLDITRNEPRDIFDVWFLLQRRNQFDFDFNQIRESFKERFGFYPSLTLLVSHLNKSSFKSNWYTRLNKQIAALPDINQVIDDIEHNLELLFK